MIELLKNLAAEHSLWSILVRFIANFIVLFILVVFIYYKNSKKEEYLFSYFLLGIIIFMICSLLQTVDIKLGMALGLFAIFGILRFRTVNYTVKEMTYMFTVIGISIINSQAQVSLPILGAVVVNSLILLAAYVLEMFLKKKAMTSLILVYRKMELLLPQARQELLYDLSVQTGQKIEKVIINRMDLGKKSAEIEVFYKKVEEN
jgi:hypothetical protein